MRAVAFALLVFLPGTASADVQVEYVGHASFVIESPSGIRVVIDPFNSNRWLGYSYPDVEADVVLVSHPHYDHDASYYWGESVPVFREPGEYRVADVTIVGVEGRHADPYGKDFEQKNTIWVVTTGGVRIAHLGDNGPVTERQAEGVGRVDMLMLPADGDDHILKPDEIAAARAALGDPAVVPMHYRLVGFHDLPESLGPIAPWLEGQRGVVRLGSHRAIFSDNRDPERRVIVFEPSPDLRRWSDALVDAWKNLDDARDAMREGSAEGLGRAGALVERAAASSSSIVFAYQRGRALAMAGSDADAVLALESGLASAGRDDWENRMRARALLASLYEKQGRTDDARTQYEIVIRHSYRTELLDQAKDFLEKE